MSTETKEIKEIEINGEVYSIKDTTARSPEWENVGYHDADIISETTFELMQISDSLFMNTDEYGYPCNYLPIEGYEYTVTFNGTTYNSAYTQLQTLGNIYKLMELMGESTDGFEDTGEPFCIGFNLELKSLMIYVFENLSNVTISINGCVLIQIPNEFIPENEILTLDLTSLGMDRINADEQVYVQMTTSDEVTAIDNILLNASKIGVIKLRFNFEMSNYASILSPGSSPTSSLSGSLITTATIFSEFDKDGIMMNSRIITYYDRYIIYVQWYANTLRAVMRPLAFYDEITT